MAYWILAGLVVVGAIVWFLIDERLRLRFMRFRRDHRDLWRRAFPESDFQKVETMLTVICESFCIPLKYCYRLKPTDDIHRFYVMNTKGSCVDSLEYQFLCDWLEEDFQLDAEKILSERPCTVGYLVRQVATPLKRMRSDPSAPADSRR